MGLKSSVTGAPSSCISLTDFTTARHLTGSGALGTIEPYFRHLSMAVLRMSVVGRRRTGGIPALSSKKKQETLPCRTDNMMKRIYALESSAAVNYFLMAQ
jgi:hypothetical protein